MLDAEAHFMIIDDNSFEIFVLEKMLYMSKLAASIISFTTVDDALIYIKAKTQNKRNMIILLDLQMPVLNGFDFVSEYAKLSEDIQSKFKIYMLSSTIDPDDINDVKKNPHIVDLLSKPIDIEKLKKIITQ